MPVLDIPGADVIDDGIAKKIMLYLFFGHIPCLFPDDHRQLRLIIQAVHNIAVAGDRIPWAYRLVCPLGKINGIGPFTVKGFVFKAG